MKHVSFAIEKITDEETGQILDAVVKTTTIDEPMPVAEKETWCTILDLDKLFGTCVKRWGGNWNLDKVCQAIQDTEIE